MIFRWFRLVRFAANRLDFAEVLIGQGLLTGDFCQAEVVRLFRQIAVRLTEFVFFGIIDLLRRLKSLDVLSSRNSWQRICPN